MLWISGALCLILSRLYSMSSKGMLDNFFSVVWGIMAIIAFIASIVV